MPKGMPAQRSFTSQAKGDASPKVFHKPSQRGCQPKGLSQAMFYGQNNIFISQFHDHAFDK